MGKHKHNITKKAHRRSSSKIRRSSASTTNKKILMSRRRISASTANKKFQVSNLRTSRRHNKPLFKRSTSLRQPRVTLNEYNALVNLGNTKLPLFNVNRSTEMAYTNMYDYLFPKLREEQINAGIIEHNWKFIIIVLEKNTNTNEYILSAHYSLHNTEALPTGTQPISNDIVLMDGILHHLSKVIKDASLGSYIKYLLDEGKKVKITLDLFVGRTLSHAGFHKDTREHTGFYTALTFNMKMGDKIPGPEMTHYNAMCPINERDGNMINYKRKVVRPVIHGPYGTVGFNDMLLVHSTPFTHQAEQVLLNANGIPTTIFNVPVPFSIPQGYDEILAANPNISTIPDHFNIKEMSIEPSFYRIPYYPANAERPSFIRCRFEALNDTENVDFLLERDNEARTSYGVMNFSESEFIAMIKPNKPIRNVLRGANINVDKYADLSPDMLNKYFEQTCELVENMG